MTNLIDEKLRPASTLTDKQLRRLDLPWLADQVAEEYFADEVIELTQHDTDAYAAFAKTYHNLFLRTARQVLAGEYREEFGLSPQLWDLAARTIQASDRYPLLFGRFDFAGVIDQAPARLVEFNADTATVLAEAVHLQPLLAPNARLWNDILDALSDGLATLALTRPAEQRDVLIITMGHPEDDEAARVYQRAALNVGLRCEVAHLPSVHFSPEEGVFRELTPDDWVRYGILIKLLPWDWIAEEEPGLLADLDALLSKDLAIIVNPPYAALLQSKAMLAELYRRFPMTTGILPAGWGENPPAGRAYVTKPIFGREGENVVAYDAAGAPIATALGDYGHQAKIWQAFCDLPQDSAGHHYQAGVYWAGGACGIAFRRRDGLIVDADSEFVGHIIGP